MAKIDPLNTVTNLSTEGTATGQINANSDTIIAAFQQTLSRTGDAPNQMEAQLDMNSNRIINLLDAVGQSEPVTLRQLQAAGAFVGGTVGIQSIVPGPGVTVVAFDPQNPVVGLEPDAFVTSVSGGDGITIITPTGDTAFSIDGTVARRNAVNVFTAAQRTPVEGVLAVAGDIVPGAINSNVFSVDATGVNTLRLPNGVGDGQSITIILKFTAASTLTIDPVGYGLSDLTDITAVAGDVYLLSGVYDPVANKVFGCYVQVDSV